jgi:hypothetical protein
MAGRTSFFVVYVPADDAKPLEEWSVALPQDKEAQIGCLTDRLRAHFKQATTASTSDHEQQEIFKKQLLSQLPKGASLDDGMLQMMLQVRCIGESEA